MKYNLYFYNYNNYANRILKKEDTILGYGTPVVTVPDVEGFNFNDGVDTSHVFNLSPFSNTINTPDYLVIGDSNLGTEVINSRWFVTECKYTRKGQFVVTLHRDVIAESWDIIKSAPCYVEKGWLPYNQFDPIIIQSENFAVSQVKKSQTYLYDETNSPWIVGYIDNKWFTAEEPTPDHTITTITSEDVDYVYPSWESMPVGQYVDAEGHVHGSAAGNLVINNIILQTGSIAGAGSRSSWNLFTEGNAKPVYRLGQTVKTKTRYHLVYNFDLPKSYPRLSRYLFSEAFKGTLSGAIKDELITAALINRTYDQSAVDLMKQLDGKRIKVGNDYFILHLVPTTHPDRIGFVTRSAVQTALNTVFSTFATDEPDLYVYNTDVAYDYDMGATYDFVDYVLKASPYPEAQKSVTFVSTVNSVNQPYRLFTMPWNTLDIYNGASYITQSAEVSRNMQASLSTAFGGDSNTYLYDIQLVPYCPIRNLLNDGKIDIALGNNNRDYVKITHGTPEVTDGYIFFPASIDDQFILDYTKTISDYKLESNTDLYRLCSPNYASMFDFNAAKNDGINGINVSFSYKPHSPTIRLAPVFSGIYGQSFEREGRGLICKGDFSLPVVGSAWTNYQIQNKYQQQIFDRQIQNLEVQQDYQRTQNILSAISGGVGMTTGGAVTGAKIGGGVGAAAGAVAGATLGTIGGILDYNMQERLRSEQMDYTKDMYNYRIDTIKALPNTLSNIGVQDNINTLVPTLEYYTCTNVERRALENKIKYNGITINVIDILDNYIDYNRDDYQYIKGKLIRINNIAEDSHYLNAIIDEIYKGVFV